MIDVDQRARLAALAMDEPPSESTLEATKLCIAELRQAAVPENGRLLLKSIIACLEAAAAREVLYVYLVPHAAAAAELLTPSAHPTRVALEAARYELETLLPSPGKGRAAPDVPVTSLIRGARGDKRD